MALRSSFVPRLERLSPSSSSPMRSIAVLHTLTCGLVPSMRTLCKVSISTIFYRMLCHFSSEHLWRQSEMCPVEVRSEIAFPDVGMRSLKFDPMMYLSLPLPQFRPIFVWHVLQVVSVVSFKKVCASGGDLPSCRVSRVCGCGVFPPQKLVKFLTSCSFHSWMVGQQVERGQFSS